MCEALQLFGLLSYTLTIWNVTTFSSNTTPVVLVTVQYEMIFLMRCLLKDLQQLLVIQVLLYKETVELEGFVLPVYGYHSANQDLKLLPCLE